MDKGICPKFEKAMAILGQRWSGLIVYQLMDGPQRFCTIETSVGVSGKVLSERLKILENEGIVKRTVYLETPVRIEYSLTKKGLALKPLMGTMEAWSKNWM